MITVRSYHTPERAYIHAGYLCSLGINACVSQDPAFGGVLFGVTEAPFLLQVDESELEQARIMLAENDREIDSSVPADETPASINQSALSGFFRFALIYEVVFLLGLAIWGQGRNEVLPQEVETYLNGLAFSIGLWEFAYLSYWPLCGAIIVSNALCFFYHPTGRMLFSFTTLWGLLSLLGPPILMGPVEAFLSGTANLLTSIALALMYWSPLSERFNRKMRKGN
jgi:hypothetical protein